MIGRHYSCEKQKEYNAPARATGLTTVHRHPSHIDFWNCKYNSTNCLMNGMEDVGYGMLEVRRPNEEFGPSILFNQTTLLFTLIKWKELHIFCNHQSWKACMIKGRRYGIVAGPTTHSPVINLRRVPGWQVEFHGWYNEKHKIVPMWLVKPRPRKSHSVGLSISSLVSTLHCIPGPYASWSDHYYRKRSCQCQILNEAESPSILFQLQRFIAYLKVKVRPSVYCSVKKTESNLKSAGSRPLHHERNDDNVFWIKK